MESGKSSLDDKTSRGRRNPFPLFLFFFGVQIVYLWEIFIRQEQTMEQSREESDRRIAQHEKEMSEWREKQKEADIHPNFVETVANDKVSQFRKYFPEYKNYKLYLGIAGFSFDDSVIEEAKNRGIGIIRQVGDAVEIDDKDLKAY